MAEGGGCPPHPQGCNIAEMKALQDFGKISLPKNLALEDKQYFCVGILGAAWWGLCRGSL